jgi:hypothetical protein
MKTGYFLIVKLQKIRQKLQKIQKACYKSKAGSILEISNSVLITTTKTRKKMSRFVLYLHH